MHNNIQKRRPSTPDLFLVVPPAEARVITKRRLQTLQCRRPSATTLAPLPRWRPGRPESRKEQRRSCSPCCLPWPSFDIVAKRPVCRFPREIRLDPLVSIHTRNTGTFASKWEWTWRPQALGIHRFGGLVGGRGGWSGCLHSCKGSTSERPCEGIQFTDRVARPTSQWAAFRFVLFLWKTKVSLQY